MSEKMTHEEYLTTKVDLLLGMVLELVDVCAIDASQHTQEHLFNIKENAYQQFTQLNEDYKAGME